MISKFSILLHILMELKNTKSVTIHINQIPLEIFLSQSKFQKRTLNKTRFGSETRSAYRGSLCIQIL